MRTKVLLSDQALAIERLLGRIEGESDAERRVGLIVELVEELTAHLAVKKNVLYPMAGSAHPGALQRCVEGNAAVRRDLVHLVRASYHDEMCAARVTELRATLADHRRLDEHLLDMLEHMLSPHASRLLGEQVERFHSACMRARRGTSSARAAAS